MRRAGVLLVAGIAASVLGACAGRAPAPADPKYQPTGDVLEVVALLRRHVPDDTYRFEPARDFTGRNVYRASLIRLESLERVHADALRAGHLDDVIAFAKGRALERLRAYDLAAAQYRRAAEREGELHDDALHSAALCDALAEAIALGYEPDRPLPEGAERVPPPASAEAAIAGFDRRVALLEAVEHEAAGGHQVSIAREEIERADRARARWFVARRKIAPDGDVRAIAELQRLVARHRESRNANRNLLELADLYAQLAEEYVESHPPESLWFDPAVFQDLVDAASRLFEAVANQDGAPEKLEAGRRLEAFIAFTLRVDRDRFSP
ncbi:MAG: hypothetical protein OZ948_18080 [Deltaproteobacteria bacterium]|nr:hypothetical protein [Deltaproteobacteria bacterium]